MSTKPGNQIRLYAHTICHYNTKVNAAIIWAFSDEQILAYHAKQKQPSPPYEYETITDYWPSSPLAGYNPRDRDSGWFNKLFDASDVTPEKFSKYRDFSKTIFIDRNGSVYVNGEWSDRIDIKGGTKNEGRHFL